MLKIILAVDRSEHALRAVRKLVDMLPAYRETPSITLLTVHLPVHQFPNMSVVVSKGMLERYYDDECEAALQPSKALLDAAGVTYSALYLVGPLAETIVEHARATGADCICMGTHGRGFVSGFLLGSVVSSVLQTSPVPVVVVP